MNEAVNVSGSQSGQSLKRNIAYKLRIGSILAGTPLLEADRLKHVDIGELRAVRINLIANVVDKFLQEGEKKYGSLTLDDGSGQIRVKVFGEDVDKLNEFAQGDTLLVVGVLRSWSNEVYVTPEIMKKKDPMYLLVRKLEAEKDAPKAVDRATLALVRDKIVSMIKEAEKDGGIDIEKLILDLKESPTVINAEIKKLLEDGMAYEPRPGKLRYLG